MSTLHAENHLSLAVPVAEVDEEYPAMVPVSVDPAGQSYLLARMFRPKLAASVGAKQITNSLERERL